MSFLLALGCLLLLSTAFAVEEEFSYDGQDEWPGICVTGNLNMQSPIDIVTDAVEFDSELIDLELSGWDVPYEGVFSNTGHNVQFDPSTPGQATVRNHLGTYEVQQFHMHWGLANGAGSEHLVSGVAEELEIHFVQRKRNNQDMAARDALSVIGVIGEADDDAELTGPWAQLNVSAVTVYNGSVVTFNMAGFRYDQLLPDNLEYYYYLGSLTTPGCNEIVAWFVLRNRIKVPTAFLNQLRQVQGTDGEVLGFNFRDTQDVGGRVVTTNSQTTAKPILSLLSVLSVIMIALYS